MRKADGIKRVAERFTSLAREGKTDEAIEYYEHNAVFDDEETALPHGAGLRTPPMNELYKGIKD